MPFSSDKSALSFDRTIFFEMSAIWLVSVFIEQKKSKEKHFVGLTQLDLQWDHTRPSKHSLKNKNNTKKTIQIVQRHGRW